MSASPPDPAAETVAAQVAASEAAMAMTDNDLRIISHSRSWPEVFGLAGHPMLGRSLLWDVLGGDRAHSRRVLDWALAGNAGRSENLRMPRPDGRWFWCDAEISPWRDTHGEVGGLVHKVVPTSEERAAQASEARSSRRLELAAGLARLHVWELDFARAVLETDGREKALFDRSFSFDELVADPLATCHPDDRARVMAHVTTRPDGSPIPVEYRLNRIDGRTVWVSSVSELVMRDGHPERLFGVMQDITDRKLAELELQRAKAELEESEARYRQLADSSLDIVVRVNLENVVEYISPSVARYGYDPQALVGRPVSEFMHPDDLERRNDERAAILTNSDVPPLTRYRYRTALGDWVWCELNRSVVFDASGAPAGVVSYIRDIDARVALEDELRRKQSEAEAASTAKSEFLANMSHEIRTPLTGVVGFATMLQSMEGLTPEARRYASRIATSAETLVNVVNDILDFSKLEASQIELDPHAFDPVELLESSADLVRDRAAAKGLALDVRFEGGPPPPVTADSARLRQVLLNLLTNAVKFTEMGSITVSARFDGAAERLRVSVSDTGIGVAPEVRHRLFQRFSQVDGSSARAFGGTGLGLAICKSLIELMGGEIGVESDPGVGSTFWFEIPTPVATAPEQAAAGPPSQIATDKPLRILLVDDVAMNRELISTMLSPFEIEIVEAGSGPEAINATMLSSFDLILMDLQMPGMDGMAATRAIRVNSDLNRTTPVLAISANVLAEHVDAAKAAGMVDHIGKPIDPAELIAKIARWTDSVETAGT